MLKVPLPISVYGEALLDPCNAPPIDINPLRIGRVITTHESRDSRGILNAIDLRLNRGVSNLKKRVT